MERWAFDRIKQDLDQKIILLSGPRQVGKTTLSRSLFSRYSYLNYDVPEHRVAVQKKDWNRLSDLVIFDELHKMKNWKSWIKGIYDVEGVLPRLLITGSAKLDVARKMGDSLAGRHFLYRLHPFCLKELASQMDEGECFRRLMTVGGFPEPFLANDITYYNRWRRSHLDIILRQDLLDVENVKQIQNIETLIELLRMRVGSTVSYAALARDLECDATTVKRWLTLLENLFIIFTVTPWSKNIARSLLKEPKYYFYDNGQIPIENTGARFENLLACMLYKEMHRLEDVEGKRTALHYLRTKEGKEVDFCFMVDGIPRLLVEAKYGDTNPSPQLKWFAQFFQKNTPQLLQVVGTEFESYLSREGVHVIPITKLVAYLS